MGPPGTKQARHERAGPVLAGCGKSAGTVVVVVAGRVVRIALGEGDAARPHRGTLEGQRGEVDVAPRRARSGHVRDRTADDVRQLRVPASAQLPHARAAVTGALDDAAVFLWVGF